VEAVTKGSPEVNSTYQTNIHHRHFEFVFFLWAQCYRLCYQQT